MEVKFGTNEPVRQVRVRVIQSADLTLLGLRTAVYNYLFAKQHQGVCLLRAGPEVESLLRWSGLDLTAEPAQDKFPIYDKFAKALLEVSLTLNLEWRCVPVLLYSRVTQRTESALPVVRQTLCESV